MSHVGRRTLRCGSLQPRGTAQPCSVQRGFALTGCWVCCDIGRTMLTKSSSALARMAASRIALRTVPSRSLNLHEYQSANILREHGVNTPKGDVAKTPEEAFNIAKMIGSTNMVIKAQVLAGGRGLGHFDNGFKGGVHVGVKTPEEIKEMASKMLNAKLITKQTGAAGRICNTVAIVETVLVLTSPAPHSPLHTISHITNPSREVFPSSPLTHSHARQQRTSASQRSRAKVRGCGQGEARVTNV